MVNLTPKMKGTIHEEECKLYFLRRGYTISVPIGECEQYDFILDYENTLYKIQCKKPSYKGDTITMETNMNVSNTKCIKTSSYDKNKVDFFCSFFNDKCYLVPYTDKQLVSLRLTYPKNNQFRNVRWASEHEASYVLEKLHHPETCKSIQLPKKSKNETKKIYSWITDGSINKRLEVGQPIPEGFYKGRSGKCNQFT